jgi:hypothetical protein
MARVGVAITKQTAFRDSTQEFSNVYYYEAAAGVPSVATADSIIDLIVTREKSYHSTAVTFVRGKIWNQTGDKATTEMISQKNLSGTGARSLLSGMDKERAFLFRLRAGVDSRGNPVYLRKWFHACGEFRSGGSSGGQLDNTTGFSQAERDAQVAQMNAIGDVDSTGWTGKLCSKSGRFPTAGQTWSAHKYLEHRQLGDQWRAT